METIYHFAYDHWWHYLNVTLAFHFIWWRIADLKIQLYMEREGYAQSNEWHSASPFYDSREEARKKVKTPEMKVLMQKRRRCVRSFLISLLPLVWYFTTWQYHG